MSSEVLTSAKLDKNMFNEFKNISISNKITFKKLAERSMYLYNKDEEFRKKIENTFPNFIGESK
jgi:hypothetical protein